MTDFRALCVELIESVLSDNSHIDCMDIARRARAALADEPAVPEGREPASVTGQPSDADLHAMAFRFSQPCFDFEYIPFARAVLTRWGNPAPQPEANGTEEQVWPPSVADGCHEAAISAVTGSPEQQLLATAGNTIDNLWNELHRTVPVQATPAPAEREAAELVTWLQSIAETIKPNHLAEHQRYKRAADLLQRQVMVPVNVSERWPEFSDCDDADRVWCWSWAIGTWRLNRINRSIHSHWLPAQALPLPEVES